MPHAPKESLRENSHDYIHPEGVFLLMLMSCIYILLVSGVAIPLVIYGNESLVN